MHTYRCRLVLGRREARGDPLARITLVASGWACRPCSAVAETRRAKKIYALELARGTHLAI